jgi:hypothetical protein
MNPLSHLVLPLGAIPRKGKALKKQILESTLFSPNYRQQIKCAAV